MKTPSWLLSINMRYFSSDSLSNSSVLFRSETSARRSSLIRINEDLRAEVSERKRTEELLSESEEKYRILIDNSQDGVFIIQDGKIQFTNDAGARMVGYTVEEVIGRNFQEF